MSNWFSIIVFIWILYGLLTQFVQPPHGKPDLLHSPLRSFWCLKIVVWNVLLTCMYFMKRWHLPQRDRGFPVAAMGEKETSINSSMPVRDSRLWAAQQWPDCSIYPNNAAFKTLTTCFMSSCIHSHFLNLPTELSHFLKILLWITFKRRCFITFYTKVTKQYEQCFQDSRINTGPLCLSIRHQYKDCCMINFGYLTKLWFDQLWFGGLLWLYLAMVL